MEKPLVRLPQTGLIIAVDDIKLIGEPKPGNFIVALKDTTQAAVMMLGDKNTLVAELERRGYIQDLEPVGSTSANEEMPQLVKPEKA